MRRRTSHIRINRPILSGRNLLIPERNTYRKAFDSLEECVSCACAEPVLSDGHRASRNHPSTEEWDHNANFDHTVYQTNHGWPEGVQRMRAIAERIYNRIAPKVTVFQNTEHSVVGAMVDVATFLAGEPECMMDFVTTEVKGIRHVDILVDLWSHFKIPGSAIINKGAAVLACIDALEHAGCTVSVTVGFSSAYEQTLVEFRVAVKAPGVPMDTDRLAFVLAHPAMLRRILFACIENCPPPHIAKEMTNNYYGFGQNLLRDTDVVFFKNTDDGECLTEESATAQALSVLHEHGLLDDANTC